MDEQTTSPEGEDKSQRIITVRIPRALHERLKNVAHERRLSMNQLCIGLIEAVTQPIPPPDVAAPHPPAPH